MKGHEEGIKVLKEIKKIPNKYWFVDSKTPFSKGSQRNCTRHQVRSAISVYSNHGPSRGWGGLPHRTIGTIQLVCSACKMSHSHVKGYSIGMKNWGGYLIRGFVRILYNEFKRKYSYLVGVLISRWSLYFDIEYHILYYFFFFFCIVYCFLVTNMLEVHHKKR